MPKRSNTFQAVMFALRALLAERGLNVEESCELRDPLTGFMTEVDVVIRSASQAAPRQEITCIECRDWKRPQGPGWISEMYSKHDRLQTAHLVLASSSGFTPQALSLA